MADAVVAQPVRQIISAPHDTLQLTPLTAVIAPHDQPTSTNSANTTTDERLPTHGESEAPLETPELKELLDMYPFLRDNEAFTREQYPPVKMIMAHNPFGRDTMRLVTYRKKKLEMVALLAIQKLPLDAQMHIPRNRRTGRPQFRNIKEYKMIIALAIAIQLQKILRGGEQTLSEQQLTPSDKQLLEQGLSGQSDLPSWMAAVHLASFVLQRRNNKHSIFHALNYLIENSTRGIGGDIDPEYQIRLDYIDSPYRKGNNRVPGQKSCRRMKNTARPVQKVKIIGQLRQKRKLGPSLILSVNSLINPVNSNVRNSDQCDQTECGRSAQHSPISAGEHHLSIIPISCPEDQHIIKRYRPMGSALDAILSDETLFDPSVFDFDLP